MRTAHRTRASVLAILTAAAALALPLPAAVGASRPLPKLLSATETHTFKIRPGYIEMCGTTGCPFESYHARGAYRGRGRIRWAWHQRYATAFISYWVDDCLPNCAEGTFHRRYRGHLTAFRVRNGHFTRMNVRYRLGGRSHVRRIHLVSFPAFSGYGRVYGWRG